MWMPALTTVPPGAMARSAAGTRAPTGAKRSAASSSSGGASFDAPAHSAPRPAGEVHRCAIAGPDEGEHPAALGARHLGDDVRRRAKAVQPEALGIARHRERAVADETGAEQRRRMGVVARRR